MSEGKEVRPQNLDPQPRMHIVNNNIHDNQHYGIWTDETYNITECQGNTLTNNGQGDYNDATAQTCSSYMGEVKNGT